MSRSYRLLIAAIVGLAVLGPVNVPGHAQSTPQKADPAPQQDTKPIDLAPIRDEIQGLTRAVESIKPEGKSGDEIQREKDDLQAQQDMAKWARLMYLATAWMTGLTAIGVVLLGATLHFTRKAAIATDKVLEETVRTTDAAKASVAVADETAKRQLRAYVSATEVEVVSRGGDYECQIKIENGGQTPAYNMTSRLAFDEPEKKYDPEKLPGVADIGPRGWVQTKVWTPSFNSEVMAAISRGTRELRLWGRIDYVDAFQQDHSVLVDYRVWKSGTQWNFQPAETGNKST